MCDGTFLTEEYTYDAHILRDYFLKYLEAFPNVDILYGQRVERIKKEPGYFTVRCDSRDVYGTPFLLNATYASIRYRRWRDSVHLISNISYVRSIVPDQQSL